LQGGFGVELSVNIKFSGDRAEQHVLPAFDAAESLDGISKSLLIPINYLFEGRVRHKNFQYQGYTIDLVAVRPGSVEALFRINLAPEQMVLLKEVGIGLGVNLIYDFLKAIYARTIGKKAPNRIEQLESQRQLNSGDMAAIEDAALPSIKRAHTVINKGADSIFIFSDQPVAVRFDAISKSYVQNSVGNYEVRSKIVSVASYNANSRYGRVFDYEQGKTVPFDLTTQADGKTITTILGSITDYALAKRSDRVKSAIAIQYTSVDSVDGRIKKLIIHKARKELSDLAGEG
jgi:hypothetical protein